MDQSHRIWNLHMATVQKLPKINNIACFGHQFSVVTHEHYTFYKSSVLVTPTRNLKLIDQKKPQCENPNHTSLARVDFSVVMHEDYTFSKSPVLTTHTWEFKMEYFASTRIS